MYKHGLFLWHKNLPRVARWCATRGCKAHKYVAQINPEIA